MNEEADITEELLVEVDGNKRQTVKKTAVPKKEELIIDTSNFEEMTLEDVADVLSLTIKEDHINKLITFLCMLSAYTKTDQLNISFNSQSSSGKTYTTVEVANLFPLEDRIELSGATPTSLFYGEGKKDPLRKAKIIPFERKILILSEQSNSLLQKKLRPLLSHDKWELEYYFTNRDKKGANRAELVIIRGFPATVFCSASMRLDEQETTRAILLSSETTDSKIRASISLQARRGSNEAKFEEWLESKPERLALKTRILAIRQARVDSIIITSPDVIEQRFIKFFPQLKSRHSRDVAHLIQLIKAITLLNVWFRQQPNGTVVASQSDIDQAFEIWESLAESQDLNIPPALMEFYKKYILPVYAQKLADPDLWLTLRKDQIGVTRREVAAYYYRVERSMLNDERLRKEILPQLQNAGIIDQQKPEEGDKRSLLILPRWFLEGRNTFEENNVGSSGGVPQEVYDQFFGQSITEK